MKRALGFLISTAMVTTAMVAPAAGRRQETPPPAVPATVVLEDPFGDANGLNDQGAGPVIGFQGDNGTPADAGNASDIGKVWFTDDKLTISAHVQTELPPPGSQGLRFEVFTAVGDDVLGCARFVAMITGKAQGQTTTWQGPDQAKFFDACDDGTDWFNNGVEAQVKVETLADGTGLITITAPKDASPFLATGQTLSGTTAAVRVGFGHPDYSVGNVVQIDNTKVGADYLIAGPPEVEEEDRVTPPGCKKGKGKKKGCKKKP